jgi:hypothetical protein
MPSSAIVDFYNGVASDNRGRTIVELHNQSLSELEQVHDYIQWLFPLPERSAFNMAAPVLTDTDIRTFRLSLSLRQSLLASFSVMLRFYGFTILEGRDGPHVICGPEFASRAQLWLSEGNHNFLRITRILRSLALLGEEPYAQAFLACLEDVFLRSSATIGDRTLQYWRNAARVNLR